MWLRCGWNGKEKYILCETHLWIISLWLKVNYKYLRHWVCYGMGIILPPGMSVHLSLVVMFSVYVFAEGYSNKWRLLRLYLYCILTPDKNCGWNYETMMADFGSSTTLTKILHYGRSRHGWICLIKPHQFLLVEIIIGFKLIYGINVDIEELRERALCCAN